MPRYGFLLIVLLFAVSAQPASTQEAKPKLGSDAVPITEQTEYLRVALAPDYWGLSPFYVPQQTASACSLASIVVR